MFSSSASRSMSSSRGLAARSRGSVSSPAALGRAPAPLAHDELVAARAHLADDDRLQQPELADRVLQFGQRLLVEDAARLLRVRLDRGDVDLAVVGRAATFHVEHRPGEPGAGRRRGWRWDPAWAGGPVRAGAAAEPSPSVAGRSGSGRRDRGPSPPRRAATFRSLTGLPRCARSTVRACCAHARWLWCRWPLGALTRRTRSSEHAGTDGSRAPRFRCS